MRYFEEKNGVEIPREVTSHFYVSKETKAKKVVAARFRNSNPIASEEDYAFLGTFYRESFITLEEDQTEDILSLFTDMEESISKTLTDRYTEGKNDLLFSFNQQKSDFFSFIRKRIAEDEVRIHCLGDIFEFHYHYLTTEDLMETMHRCVDKRHPLNQGGKNLSYICLESFFEEEDEITEYMKKCRETYENIVSSNKSIAEEELKKKVNDALVELANEFIERNPHVVNDDELSMSFASLRDREVVVENLRRLFCIGCLSNNCKKKTPNYALTIIDEDDRIKTWVTNSIVINTIKKHYVEMGGDEVFENIEHFLILHDLIIKTNKGNDVTLSVVPTKYKDIEGCILVPNVRYWIMTVAIDWLGYVNKFNDKITNYFHLKNNYCPVSIINASDGKVTFRMIDSDTPYRTIEYKPFESEEEPYFNTDFLEI